MSDRLVRPPVLSSPRPSRRWSPRPRRSPTAASAAVETSAARAFDFCPSFQSVHSRNSRSEITNPSTASPRNSSDSLSRTPPLASSCARERCVRACSSNPRSRKRYPSASSTARNSSRMRVRRSETCCPNSAIRRRARRACSPRTVSRTSPSPPTARGKMAWGAPDEAVASMPRVSRSPMTTSASIVDWVRNTTWGSESVTGGSEATEGRADRRPGAGRWSCRRAARRTRRTPRLRPECAA